jgi:hypothetical protein
MKACKEQYAGQGIVLHYVVITPEGGVGPVLDKLAESKSRKLSACLLAQTRPLTRDVVIGGGLRTFPEMLPTLEKLVNEGKARFPEVRSRPRLRTTAHDLQRSPLVSPSSRTRFQRRWRASAVLV